MSLRGPGWSPHWAGPSSFASRGSRCGAFLRISTNPRVFERPLTTEESEAGGRRVAGAPVAGILDPGERHWAILRGLLREGQCTGPLVMDAALGALAIEHGAVLHTTDRDFSRFPGLRWTNPLAGP